MDLRTWIVAEHAVAHDRFEQQVAARVPRGRWTEQAGGDGSSIAWLRFHTAWHEDLAVQAVLRGQAPVLSTWREPLGLSSVQPDAGLGEAEIPEVTKVIDLDVLAGYVSAVHDATAGWLASVDLAGLDAVPEANERMTELAGVTDAAVPWLHRMWHGKPGTWLLQWEAIGHPVNHLGEMVAVRNRLGLGGF